MSWRNGSTDSSLPNRSNMAGEESNQNSGRYVPPNQRQQLGNEPRFNKDTESSFSRPAGENFGSNWRSRTDESSSFNK